MRRTYTARRWHIEFSHREWFLSQFVCFIVCVVRHCYLPFAEEHSRRLSLTDGKFIYQLTLTRIDGVWYQHIPENHSIVPSSVLLEKSQWYLLLYICHFPISFNRTITYSLLFLSYKTFVTMNVL